MRISRGWLLCLLSFAWGASVSAQEWTRFRGPNGSGLSDAATIPTEWSEEDYNWKVELPGKGHASPVIWGDRVFVCSADERDGKRILQCLRAADGSELWRREWESRTFAKHVENSFASSTPTVDGERIYLVWSTPERISLMALDHDGHDVWTRDLGPYVTQHGGGASPILYKDLVVFPNDQDGQESFLVALDCKTGEVRWKTPRKSTRFAASTPVIYEPKDDAPQLVFAAHSHGVTGVNPDDGHVIWESGGLFSQRVVGSPVAGPGVVVATCGEGARGKNLVAIEPGAPDSPSRTRYELTDETPYVPTPLVKGDKLFVWSDTGVVSCLDAATGEKVWRQRLRGTAGFFGSPVCVQDRLYCIAKDGRVYVVSAADHFKLLATNDLGEKSNATPSVAGGRMYLRTFTHLICIGGKSLAVAR